MEGKNIKVHYFDIYGRGEIIRFILNFNKVKFEDVRYTFQEWSAVKKSGNFTFGQLPALEVDGKFYAQSYSIARYLSQVFGQYPTDALEVYQVESTKDYVEDLLGKFAGYWREQDPVKKQAFHDDFLTNTLPAVLPGLNRIVKENTTGSGFLVGKNLSLADFVVAEWATKFVTHKDRIALAQPALDANPEFAAYLKALVEGEFKEYFATREYRFI